VSEAAPEPIELLGALPFADDGARWAETAAPWQVRDAEAVLAPGAPQFTWIGRPRGGRKTADGAGFAVALHMLAAPPGARSYVVAADAAQAGLVLDSVRAFVLGAPVLKSRLRIESRRVQFLDTAGEPLSSVEVLPADEASSWGLRPYLLVADELSVWPTSARGLWVSVVSSLPKVARSRLVVLTSAGDPAHWSASVLAHARTSESWQVLETAGPLPWVSEVALGEQRALLTDSQYRRLHLNEWVASEDRLVSIEGLAACVTLDAPQEPRPGVRYRMGLDLGLTHDATAIAVAHAEVANALATSDDAESPYRGTDFLQRRVVLDRLVTFQGAPGQPVRLDDVTETVFSLWRSYNHPRVRADPFQAAGLVQALRSRGVTVEEWPYTAMRYGEMASVLFALLRDGRIALYDDAELRDELANVRLVETIPGQLRIQHDPGRHDDRCVALGMAIVPLVRHPTGTLSLQLPDGVLPSAPIVRQDRPSSEPPVRVVREGEERPVERLLTFAKASRHPNYSGPGRRLR
jgi:phage terminase large subunit-like protein